jgi:predicted dehydrogenase
MDQGQQENRREFLRQSATAVLAASAPTVITSGALGAQGKSAASNRITLGFIGMGTMNHGHLGGHLGRSDVQVLAVCDVDKTRREAARETVEKAYAKKERGSYKGCDAYRDFRELLARKDIDAVVIATPDHWHAIPVIEACKAKKDIYCEKPLTLTIYEAKVLIEAVRKHDRVFQTGSQQRSEFDGKFRKACEYVRSGKIGKVLTVFVGCGGSSRWCDLPEEPMEPGLDWDTWLGPAPKRPYNSVLSPRGVHKHFPNWRSYREYSGGGMTDFGAHHYDIAQWGLGMDDSGPVEVIPPDDEKATVGLRFKYANGVEMVHGGPDGITFVGTHGVIAVDRGRLSSVPESILKEPPEEQDVHLFKSPGHAQNWLDCIRSRQRPIADVAIGAHTVTVCHLANLGYWNRRKLRWDPKAWQFVGDANANTWLDYKRRDPWQLPAI